MPDTVEAYDEVAAELEQHVRRTFPRTTVDRYWGARAKRGIAAVAFLNMWYLEIVADKQSFTSNTLVRLTSLLNGLSRMCSRNYTAPLTRRQELLVQPHDRG